MTPTLHRGGGVRLCEPIDEPEGPAVKSRLLRRLSVGQGVPHSFAFLPSIVALPFLLFCLACTG